MNWLTTILILVTTSLAVFWESAFHFVRDVTGAQVHWLPSLMVYSALRSGLTNILIVAVFGGLSFDSLSANPLGVSVLPLFLIGILIHGKRDLILQDQTFAQSVLGAMASVAWPVGTMLLLLTHGQEPLLGWGSLWQLLVVTAAGAVFAPLIFEVLGWAERTFGYHRIHETSFRSDREIRRGR
jgi:rod shape-determining protein MreD